MELFFPTPSFEIACCNQCGSFMPQQVVRLGVLDTPLHLSRLRAAISEAALRRNKWAVWVC